MAKQSRPGERSRVAVRELERLLEAATALSRAETEAEAAQLTAAQAMELLGADRVQVMCAETPGSSRFVNRGQCDIPIPLGEALVDAATEPSGTGVAVRTGQTVFVADAETSPVVSRRLADLLHPKSMVFVPLPGEGGYLGAVVAIWNSPRAGLDRFSQRAAELLSVEAGRALERTRAADRLARDLGWHREAEASFRQERAFLRLLNTIAVAANEAGSVEEALQRALDEVCAYTGWAVGHVYVPDGTGTLVPTPLWHLDDADHLRVFRETTDQTPLPVGAGLPGRVAASGRPAPPSKRGSRRRWAFPSSWRTRWWPSSSSSRWNGSNRTNPSSNSPPTWVPSSAGWSSGGGPRMPCGPARSAPGRSSRPPAMRSSG